MDSPPYPEVVKRVDSLEETVVVLQTQIASLITLVQSYEGGSGRVEVCAACSGGALDLDTRC